MCACFKTFRNKNDQKVEFLEFAMKFNFPFTFYFLVVISSFLEKTSLRFSRQWNNDYYLKKLEGKIENNYKQYL